MSAEFAARAATNLLEIRSCWHQPRIGSTKFDSKFRISQPVSPRNCASWAVPRFAPFVRMAVCHAIRRGLAEAVLRHWRRVRDPSDLPSVVPPADPAPPPVPLPALPLPPGLPAPVALPGPGPDPLAAAVVVPPGGE